MGDGMYYQIYKKDEKKICPVCGRDNAMLCYRIDPENRTYRIDGSWGEYMVMGSLRLELEIFLKCSRCYSEIEKTIYTIDMKDLNVEIARHLRQYMEA